MRNFLIVCALGFCGSAGMIYGQESAEEVSSTLPGHSQHGEVFNEGPRQAASLMEGTGKVHFPVTTKSAEAQKFFNQGVGQLHGFWYYEAERSFRQVLKLDPDCVMAYWGCAMANVNNPGRAKGFIEKAAKNRDKVSAREQLWIDALKRFHEGGEEKNRHQNFIKDLEDIVHENPKDLEAKAFLGWAIWKADSGGVPLVSREAVDAILREVLIKESLHPAHHYRIHLWDRGKAKQALDSAAQCGPSAPAIAHMWHMPAHTYTKTNRLAESAWSQEAALRVDHAYIARTRILADQIHNYAHNAEWLIRVWNQQGRAADSIALAKNLLSMPRHPKGNTLEKKQTMASYGRTRLYETLLKFELWDEVLALDGSPLLDVTLNRSHELSRLHALGVSAFFKKDMARLAKVIGNVEVLKKAEALENAKSVKKEKNKTSQSNDQQKQTDKNGVEPSKKEQPAWGDVTLNELKLLLSILQGNDRPELIKQLENKPLTDVISMDFQIRYWIAVGNLTKAVELSEKLPEDAAGLALRVHVLMLAGKKEDAKKWIQKAGEVASTMDLDLPFAHRLDEIAKELGMENGWRKELQPLSREGRPDLNRLGPIHWQPVMAKEMKVKTSEGKSLDLLSHYEGKPMLVLWYLGGECTHCVAQLKAFQKVRDKFKDSGVEVVAIGYEKPDELLRTAKVVNDGKEPDPDRNVKLFADENLEAFKTWRCYDDFEGSALHGTFLIDGQGRVRWQDISYEPFENTTFLLAETKRLLQIP